MADRIFPLVERRTPLLDRLQNGKGSDFTEQAAKELVAVRESDEEEIAKLMESFSQNFRESLAKEMGVDEDEINPELVEEFMGFVFFEGPFSEPNTEDTEDDDEGSNALKDLTPDQE